MLKGRFSRAVLLLLCRASACHGLRNGSNLRVGARVSAAAAGGTPGLPAQRRLQHWRAVVVGNREGREQRPHRRESTGPLEAAGRTESSARMARPLGHGMATPSQEPGGSHGRMQRGRGSRGPPSACSSASLRLSAWAAPQRKSSGPRPGSQMLKVRSKTKMSNSEGSELRTLVNKLPSSSPSKFKRDTGAMSAFLLLSLLFLAFRTLALDTSHFSTSRF